MDNIISLFFEVSSEIRGILRKASAGPLSIIEMRGLEFLVENPDALQKDVAEFYGITTASASAFFKKMESRGLVERRRDQDDKRASVLRVTPAGLGACRKTREGLGEISRPFFQDLTRDDLEAFENILNKIKRNMG
jgi:DNA-binding MarR family transcriptional regulator